MISPKSSHLDIVGANSLISSAHPAIKQLSCALIHPTKVSCARAFITSLLSQSQKNCRIIFALYAVTSIPRYRILKTKPIEAIINLFYRALKTSTFVTLSIATTWSSICYIQRWLPVSVLAQKAFYISGFLGGLSAFIDRRVNRTLYLDAARNAAIAWWRNYGATRNTTYSKSTLVSSADVILFTLSIAILNILYEIRPAAITSNGFKELLKFLRVPILSNKDQTSANGSEGDPKCENSH